jgi:hypothetical protein
MAPEQTQTLLSRRAWLARVGAAGALGAAAPFVASAPAAAAGDASIAGVVVGDAGAGRLLVSLEPDARVVTARVEGIARCTRETASSSSPTRTLRRAVSSRCTSRSRARSTR